MGPGWALQEAKNGFSEVVESACAATVLVHGPAAAARNVADFTETGAAVFHPFA